jgi:O-antigen/teichoic acid export membrane protein
VLLPALAEGHRQSHQALVLTFKKARRVILPAGAYLCLGVALGAPAFFNYLYDSRYHDAAWITPLLMVGAWFVFLQEASGRALQAMGNARALAAANFVKLLVTAAACVAGHRLAGMLGFLIGAGLGAFSGHLVTMVMLARARLPAGWDDLAFSAGAAAIAAAGVIVPRYLAPRLELSLPLVSLGVAVVILAPLGGAVGWWTLREAKGRR